MLDFKTHYYQFQQSLNNQKRNRTQSSDSKGRLTEKRCTLSGREFALSMWDIYHSLLKEKLTVKLQRM